MSERADFQHWSVKDVARLRSLLEAELGYYREIAAKLPIPLAIVSQDRTVVWSNRAFRARFNHLPAGGFTEIPIRAWHDEDETESLLVFGELTAAGSELPRTSTQVPAILWQADAKTLQFRSVEGAVEAMLGYPASHWLGHREFFEERIFHEDRAATMAVYRGVLSTGGEASAEYRAVTASGALSWCRETIRVSGITVTGVTTDIGNRKQLEQQLLSAGRFQTLHEFAGRMAHDLNNPLMIVTGYAEELLQGLKASDPLRTEATEILGAARRMGGITAQLTEFVRHQGKTAERITLGDAILNLRSKITAAAGERVAVELTVNRTAVSAMANPDQLGEILAAVIAGTRDSARERTRITIGWDVTLVAERLSPTALAPGKYARITILDDGPGLDADQAAAVFDPVFSKKADPAAVAAGLALARAYSIVHEWSGDIAFRSLANGETGSRFTIYLPCPDPDSPVAAPAQRLDPSKGERQTILVVEDEKGIRELIRKILIRERYRVLEAASAEDALAAAEGQGIDLLLTDIRLPGLTGLELARRMQLTAPALRALYISGHTGKEKVPPGALLLAKPFTLAALLEKVREALA